LASLKKVVKTALLDGDFDHILQMADQNKRVFGVLISLAYDKDSLVTWRSIEAMGLAVGALAERDTGMARDIIHRLLWLVTEESGSIGWSSPEMLSEIVVHGEGRFDDLPPIIFSLHEEPPFVRGVLWAMGRLAEAGAAPVEGAAELVNECLGHEDPQVRGLAVWAAGQMGLTDAAERIRELSDDQHLFHLYQDHQLNSVTIGELAQKHYAVLQGNYLSQ
jgi:hypothetical protein